MYFHKPQEKPCRWGSFQDIQFAIRKNCEKIYDVDPDSIVLAMPLFWGLPPLDYSGKNNHGTNHGATYKDGSLDFDGNNDYVLTKSGKIIADSTNSSIFVCMKTMVSSASSGYSIYSERAAAGLDIWKLDYADACYPNEEIFFTHRDDGGTLTYVRTGTNLSDDVMHFVGVTKAGTSVKLYSDGVRVGLGILNGSDTFTNAGIESRIGGDKGDANAYFDGLIDEVRISNVDRTADQIALFHDLPWALYQPVQRPVYFFQATVGGVTMPIFMSNHLRQMGA